MTTFKEVANFCRGAWIWSTKSRPKPVGTAARLQDHEFRVFSQNGEDGIINYLFSIVGAGNKVFVEFGFGTTQNNCLRLLLHEHFTGFFFDGEAKQVARFRRLGHLFPGVLKRCVASQAFFDRENVNDIIGAKVMGEIALLSLDVDGVDYHLWEALECVSPRVVVIEFNAAFGSERSVTVPYSASFDRNERHPLGFYHGASLAALAKLGNAKGYALVGTDKCACNAFFVRRDLLQTPLLELTAQDAYHPHAHRIARGFSAERQWQEVSKLPFTSV